MGSTADEDRRLYASLCRRIAEGASEADVRAVVRAALDRLQAPGLRDSILERVAVWRDRHDVLVGAGGGRRRLVWRRVESAFHGRLFGGIISNRGGLYALPEEFFEAALPVVTREVRRAARDFGPLRINGVLHARFWNPARETSATIPVSSGTFVVYPGEDVSSRLGEKLVNAVLQVLDSFEEGESGLAFEEILYLKVNVNKLIMLSGAGDPLTNTWVPLPIWLQRTKALVNVRNADNKCFLWSVLASLHPVRFNAGRVANYRRLQYTLRWRERDFPMTWRGIRRFEEENDLRIYVFAWDESERGRIIHPWFASRRESGRIVDLFVTPVGQQNCFHFVCVRDVNRLLHGQLNTRLGRGTLCRNCLRFLDPRSVRGHLRDCGAHRPCRVDLPQCGRDDIMTFKNHRRREPVPVVCYGDFECALSPGGGDDDNVEHVPLAAGLYVHVEDYVGRDRIRNAGYAARVGARKCVRWLLRRVIDTATSLAAEYSRNVAAARGPLPADYLSRATACSICGGGFAPNAVRCLEHDHWTGRIRGVAHGSCNLNYKEPRVMPVFFHNLSGYDGHFLVDELTRRQAEFGDVDILPSTKEDYISFSILSAGGDVRVRFVDSYRFAARSLDALSQNLSEEAKAILRSEFSDPRDWPFVGRKLAFPYDWLTGPEKLAATSLPPLSECYNAFTDTGMSPEDYEWMRAVWNHFQSRLPGTTFTMKHFLLLYLKVDVCLLGDVLEAFRRTCRRTYDLDPAHYLTAPSLALEAALKQTGAVLNLLLCSEMVHFIERGIRGGVAQCSGRYAEANAPGTPDYDAGKPTGCIVDIDANSLYAWCMTQPLPTGAFQWVPESAWDTVGKEGADYGYFLEVDFPDYPQRLREDHEDLPLAPEHRVPPPLAKQQHSSTNKWCEKLVCTFYPKERYVVHHRVLDLYRRLGYPESRIRRVLRFEQSPWLKSYIELNINKRREATNEFERDFYKFMNNSVFGKFIENVRLRRRVKIVRRWAPGGGTGGRSSRSSAAALVASPQFHSRRIMDENRVIVELSPSKIYLNKPIYVGAAVLDLAKLLMYRFHYEVVRARVRPPPKLLYTDTDSLIYYLPEKTSFADLHALAPHCFDTSNYPTNHPLRSTRHRDCLGKFKDEVRGRRIKRFVGLRAKMYCVEGEGGEVVLKRAKGLRAPVVRKFTAETYVRVLYGGDAETTATNKERQLEFRSRGHRVFTAAVKKTGLSAADDKRFVCPDQPERTLPWSPETEYMYLNPE